MSFYRTAIEEAGETTGDCYDMYGSPLYEAFNVYGDSLNQAYDIYGNPLLGEKELDDLLPGRLLIWHDEFDGLVVNQSKWSTIYGDYRGYCWNSEDINRNAKLNDGILSYSCKKDYPNNVSDFSGAYLHTNNKFEFRYGMIEAKMKFPTASPHHTTFWTLGADSELIPTGETTRYNQTFGVLPPSCGEIDFAEYDNGTVGARTHWSTVGLDSEVGYTQGGNIGSLTSTPSDWHIYGCEWTESTIKFYVDRVLKGTWNTSNATVNGWNPFHIPHYLIFNCISRLSGTIEWDIATTQVDWVRVYAPEGVTEYINETGISLNSNTLTLSVGGTHVLMAEFTPVNPSDMTLLWSSDNETVAKCYGGKVTAISEGTANITCKTKRGHIATCTVTVS